MSSVSSPNLGVTNLLQSLSSLNSSALSSLSSKPVVSALENAPPADVVKLSMAATQLQGMSEMFGIPDASTDPYGAGSSSTTDPSTMLANLVKSMTGSSSSALASATTSAAPSSGVTMADQLAKYQQALQAAQTQALFGTGSSNDSNYSGSMFSVLA